MVAPDRPFISFLVPSYNRAKVLPAALRSVLDQSDDVPGDWEIVVVDDGSTDDTTAALASFENDARVRVFRHTPNRGVAVARNVGLRNARGEWVVLLDSDNRLLPGSLRALVTDLRALGPDVVVFWGGSVDRFGRSTLNHSESGVFDGPSNIGGRFTGEHFSAIRASTARKHLFAELGTRNECAECFWIPVFLDGSVCISQKAFQYYETSGADRVCSIENRLGRAGELARCYEAVLARFGQRLLAQSPKHYWNLRGKMALYGCMAGSRWTSVVRALGSVGGFRFAPENLAIAALCIAGPRAARRAFRYRAAAQV